jgi:toxin ParE1/3/4
MELVFDRRAERDLEDIGDFIAKDNPTRAVSFVREIRDHCARLLQFPEAARLHPELGEGVRVSVYRRYLVFHAVENDVLRIRRVIHGARNLDDLI